MRILRAIAVLGAAAGLVAMPTEDYARMYATARVASANAIQLVERHIVRPVMIAVSPRDKEPVVSAPPPRLAVRPSLLDDEARRNLANVRMPDLKPAMIEPLEEKAAARQEIAAAPATATTEVPAAPPPAAVPAGAVAGGPADQYAVTEVASVPADAVGTSSLSAHHSSDGRPASSSDQPPKETVAALPPDAAKPAIGEDPDLPPPPERKTVETAEKKPPVAAKILFGSTRSAAPLAARAIGYYSRGCLSGAKALPVDGPSWQAMRLSRNRNWGHPDLVKLLERFASEVQKQDGWPGLLVGDMSQPRGGPMLTGHSSHQIGLDADIWFTPMPSRRLSKKEREDLAATSMIDGPLKVDPTAFTNEHVKVVKRAASYGEVERILVHPAIKKALCEKAGTDRAWLSKVRPYFGHFYHFHMRMACPKGSSNCRSQPLPANEDGCGKELDDWFARLTRPPEPPAPGTKPQPPKPPLTLTDLPLECRVVLTAGNSEVVKDEAELIKTSNERSKRLIDISGKPRSEALAHRPSR